MEGLKIEIVNKYTDKYIPHFFNNIEIQSENIADHLKTDYQYWTPDIPILIDAPTGTGKTTFVYNVLIPHAAELHKNILIVSNRVALNIQQKKVVLKSILKKPNGYFSDMALQDIDDYGFIHIVTYQGLLSHIKVNHEWMHNLEYVIFDEAHFFASDSFFNPYTQRILDNIPSTFHSAIRIYMTATSWSVLEPLAYVEQYRYSYPTSACVDAKKYPTSPSPLLNTQIRRTFCRYYKKPDYSQYKLEFVLDFTHIVEKIKSKPKEKWIIFVNDKSFGKKILSTLKSNCPKSRNRFLYFDAEEKKQIYDKDKSELNAFWNRLLTKNEFEQQVLITTSVLDCGINIEDESVKNIAICTEDRTEFVQMLGRRRLNGKNDRVKLWVLDPDPRSLRTKNHNFKNLLYLSQQLFLAQSKEKREVADEIWNNPTQLSRSLFYPKKTDYFGVNQLVKYEIERKIYFLDNLIESTNEDTIRNYHTIVESWLNIKAVNSECFSSEEINEARDDLLDFLEENKSTLLKVKNNEKIWDKYLTEEQVQFLKDKINTCREMNAIKSNKNHDTIEGKGYTIYLEKLGIKDFKLHTKKCGEWYIEKTE